MFIKQVIYGLKREYGQAVTLVSATGIEVDPASGFKSALGQSQIFIPKAIALPIDRRNAFLKSVGIHQTAEVQIQDRQFLIDRDDLLGQSITKGMSLVTENVGFRISLVEFFPHALVVTCVNTNQFLAV